MRISSYDVDTKTSKHKLVPNHYKKTKSKSVNLTSINSVPAILKNGTLASDATALASNVLPQPGGLNCNVNSIKFNFAYNKEIKD